jgi:hypothetical protein
VFSFLLISFDSVEQLHLHKKFNEEFYGAMDNTFIEALQDDYHTMYEISKYYGQCNAIIQSSGTGKTRLISEVGKKVCLHLHNIQFTFDSFFFQLPVVFICLQQLGTSGWPLGDITARDFLLDVTKAQHSPVSILIITVHSFVIMLISACSLR